MNLTLKIFTKNIKAFFHLSACLILFGLFNKCFGIDLSANGVATPDTSKRNNFVLVGLFQQGWVIPTNSFVEGNNVRHLPIKYFYAAAVEFFRQTTGDRLWEQLYNYPRYGFGIYGAKFIHCPEIGRPVVFHGMLDNPIFRVNNLSLNSDIGIGLAFGWESFTEDYYNIAFGAKESAYFDCGFSFEYNVKPGFLFTIGMSFIHYSNGALKKPNFGINLLAPKVSIGYNFNSLNRSFKHQTVPAFNKKSDLFLSFYAGGRNALYYGNDVDSVTKNRGVFYQTYGLSAVFNRQVSYKLKFGIGFMADYLGSAGMTITAKNGNLDGGNASLIKGLELSIFPSAELVIDRLSLIIQPGIYLYRSKYPFRLPVNYQRIGIKYDVLKNVSLGFFLRAYEYNTSDFIEWIIGYRFDLRNKTRYRRQSECYSIVEVD